MMPVPSVNTAYLDCFSGISGDMLLGSLISAGVSAEALEAEFAKLGLDPFDFIVSKKKVQSITAVSVTIEARTPQKFKNLPIIVKILEDSDLDREVIDQAIAVFTRLAEAEAKVHGKPVDQIHFHEVGALDTIVDVVGVITGLKLLGIHKLHCSPLPLGRGFVKCAHGRLPLPAPAVCNLLKHIPVYGIAAEKELVTPTGAALAAGLCSHFGQIPPMRVHATGYGAGQHEGTEDRPNLLRIITGCAEEVAEAQEVMVIETNLDDWNPEGFPYLCETLFANRALDVSVEQIHMKKGRPGFRLQVICTRINGPALKDIVLTETTAIGVRFRFEQRTTLPREIVEVETQWGKIAAKRVTTPAGSKLYPEYEACRLVAQKQNLPLDTVYRRIIADSLSSS